MHSKSAPLVAPRTHRLASCALAAAIAIGAVAFSPAALAEPAIQSVTTAHEGASEVVRIQLSEPLAVAPSGFAVQTPPRVAIDLPAVSNALGRTAVDVNQGNLRSVSVAQGADRTRLVMNLKTPASFRTRLQGNALLVTLDPPSAVPMPSPVAAPVAVAGAGSAAASTVVSSTPTQFAAPQNASSLAVRDIDFRRAPDGAGRVVVDLASPQVGVDIRQQGQSLIVEFLRSSLPDALRRRLDVSDFGTPVQAISTVQAGDKVRMTIDPRGAWEHSAYQTDNQFVVEVRPVRLDPNKLTPGPGFSGEKLSLNFQNIEVRSLLQVIADFTNFNVVTSDTVTGNVTLRLKDVPWDQALDIILQSKGLGVRKSGNVLWVAPKEELHAKEQVELEARKKMAEIEPLRTQSFQLNYTKAEDIARSINGSAGGASAVPGGGLATRILSTRGSAIFETRTNQLFVTDIPSKLEEITGLIAKIDVPVRQVLIEARIVEADDTFGRSLGVKWGATDLRGLRGGTPGWGVGGNNRVALGAQQNSLGYQTLQNDGANGGNDFVNTNFVNLPANTSSLGGATAATLALSLFSATANRFLNLELSALEAEGKGKIVSSPRVVTADQVKALIEQGEELPYQQATSSGATSVSFRKANLKLEVTPQITPEGNVILDVDVNKDSVGRLTVAGYAIDTKHVKTQVLVENGGTVVLGGIFTQNEREEVNKVPLLGDIPYMGNLFKNKQRIYDKTELLVFITPKIVSDRSAAR